MINPIKQKAKQHNTPNKTTKVNIKFLWFLRLGFDANFFYLHFSGTRSDEDEELSKTY